MTTKPAYLHKNRPKRTSARIHPAHIYLSSTLYTIEHRSYQGVSPVTQSRLSTRDIPVRSLRLELGEKGLLGLEKLAARHKAFSWWNTL
jgi:hypothetical protein